MSFGRKYEFYSFILATNLDNEDGGSVVADPGGHLSQAFVVGGGREQEPPVLSVLKQEVGVDEQDAGELKHLIYLGITKEAFTFGRKSELN